MKKLIFLSGPASSGKTTTLKMLIVKLLQAVASIDFLTQKPYPTSQALQNTLINAIKNNTASSNDIIIILKIDGVKIGIRTMGDSIGNVWDNVWFFEKHKCDIGVSACHPEHLDRSIACLAAPWKCKEIIDKKKTDNSNAYYQENDCKAQTLFDIIMATVNQINQSQQAINQAPSAQGKI